jgi:pimeloyl-ACP methyl ester carboxylesterase
MTIAVNLNYSEQGSGTPLVLLHGFPLSSAIWREQQARLSDHYRVITPDLRGHGRSPVTDDVYGMELMAADVLALLDALTLPQAVVMGHSMGGYVALAMADRAPGRLSALGIIGSHPFADTEDARQGRYKLANKVKLEGSGAVVEFMLPRLFAPNPPDDETLTEQVTALMQATRPLGLIGTLQGMAVRPDTSTLLATLDLPVLLVAGDKDAIVPLARMETMAASLKKGLLATIENAGHMMMMEQPQATTMAIRQFLEELAQPRSLEER